MSKKDENLPNNFFEFGDNFIGVIGTFSYNRQLYESSIANLIKNDKFDISTFKNLYGHYLIFIWNGLTLRVISDGSNLLRSYFIKGEKILCSSFDLLLSLSLQPLHINIQAVIENLITGGIIGEETIIKEINLFNGYNLDGFENLTTHVPSPRYNLKKFSKRSEALKYQVEVLDDFFSGIVTLSNISGADTGLTGGYDSRLLLAFLIRHFKQVQVHSHKRSIISTELNIAKEISEAFRIKFVSPTVKAFDLLSDDELKNIMSSARKFYDSQIRIHCFWVEEYNTLEYRLRVLNGIKLGFHGIGGEQYRNADRFYNNQWDYHNWIKYKYIRRIAGEPMINEKAENDLIEYLKDKINKHLGFETNKKSINLLDLKRIQNEIFIPSFRGARTAAENKISFFLSPFADYHISHSAYSIVPFLGNTNDFEIDLIKMISPELAEFPSDYGFRFNQREPFSKYIIPTILENFLPFRISWEIREHYKKSTVTNPFTIKAGSSKLVKSYIENVYDLALPLKIDKLMLRPDIAPLVISMGYFLENYNTSYN